MVTNTIVLIVQGFARSKNQECQGDSVPNLSCVVTCFDFPTWFQRIWLGHPSCIATNFKFSTWRWVIGCKHGPFKIVIGLCKSLFKNAVKHYGNKHENKQLMKNTERDIN